MLRYLFRPRLSLFDTTAIIFVLGSIPSIGWWALLAAFVLIVASSIIEVAIMEPRHDTR